MLFTDDVLGRIKPGIGPVDAGDLIVDLTDRIVYRMSDTVDNFEDQVMALGVVFRQKKWL